MLAYLTRRLLWSIPMLVAESIVGSANVSSVGVAEAGRQLDVVIERIGGPAGILTSMAIHPWMVARFGRKP